MKAELCNGRVFYKSSNAYIYWNKKCNIWQIGSKLGTGSCYGYLPADILFPTLTAKHWRMWEGRKYRTDRNIFVREIKDEVNFYLRAATLRQKAELPLLNSF